PNLLTRDIGRIFFGRDLQCAQCHDHPLVDDYLQSDYQGLLAFVAPGYIKTVNKPGPPDKEGKPGKPVAVKIYAEKDGNDISFESVFVKDTKHRTGPRLVGEKSMLEPDRMPTSGSVKTRPLHSRRQMMAIHATDGSNRAFNENIANRLWGMMMGRGLVDPPDFHHRDNPPSRPRLMRELGERMVAMKFNMKEFLVQVALSKAYQRIYDLPRIPNLDSEVKIEKEKLQAALVELEKKIHKAREHYDLAADQWQEKEARYIPAALEVEKLRKEYATLDSQTGKLKAAWEAGRKQAESEVNVVQELTRAVGPLAKAVEIVKDGDVQALQKRVREKLEKLKASSKAKMAKNADAEKKYKASQLKWEASKKGLKQGYANRLPLRQALAEAEKPVRLHRSNVADLVSLRTTMQSRLATLEKLLEFSKLNEEVNVAKGSSGEPSEELVFRRNRIEDSLVVRLSRSHVLSLLRPLTPEQYCWSTLRVTGVYQRYFAGEEAKLRKKFSLPSGAQLTRDQLRQVEEATFNVLKGHLQNFVRYYGAGAGQPQGDFFATADQALFAVNGSTLNSYVNPASGNVTDRMIKAGDHRVAAEELYLAVLSRMPDDEEIGQIAAYLESSDRNKEAARELVWSLLNSAEFRFNH
ncbi:MAG: DUF1553 domain-containing protein, partial [Planctomycetota bacterium]|nr:DUF1553 domain-containing protein [Planctomycetota bacterium]